MPTYLSERTGQDSSSVYYDGWQGGRTIPDKFQTPRRIYALYSRSSALYASEHERPAIFGRT